MAPYYLKRGGVARERLLVLWQVLLSVFVVAIAAGVAIALLVMPRTGFECRICEYVTCQSFLGWECNEAVNRDGFCRVLVFPDASASLICPSGFEIPFDAAMTVDQEAIDESCEMQCGAAGAVNGPIDSVGGGGGVPALDPADAAPAPPAVGGGGGGGASTA